MVSASSFIGKIRPGDRVSTWSVVTLLAGLLLVGPFVALFVTATGDSGGLWSHLMQTVFPRYVGNTLTLMAGVAIISLGFGVTSAWIVARFRFPGDRVLEWMLLLPATVPAYIIAYTYTDLLEYAGPVQGILRDAFGWRSAQDYWFPEIRSIGGAMLVMASVLYPYIYLLARTAFRLTPASYFEVARLHNRNFTLTADLALARPAIVAGLALVLMEVISDFGTVDYFAVETLTLGIFNVWLGMNSLTAAAQIAGIAFIFIIGLLYIERTARSRQRFTDTTQRSRALEPAKTTRVGGMFCAVACLAPIILGFGIPVGVLLNFIFQGLAVSDPDALSRSAMNSVLVSLVAAICVVVLATVTALTVSYKETSVSKDSDDCVGNRIRVSGCCARDWRRLVFRRTRWVVCGRRPRRLWPFIRWISDRRLSATHPRLRDPFPGDWIWRSDIGCGPAVPQCYERKFCFGTRVFELHADARTPTAAQLDDGGRIAGIRGCHERTANDAVTASVQL